MIYLDNAATTLQKPASVIQAVVQAMQSCGNCGRGCHTEALDAARTVYDVRQQISRLFHGPGPERVAFTLNSTQALNLAINGLLGPGDHVISTDWEHNSVLRPLYRLRDRGMELDFVPADARGQLDYSAFERLLRPNTRAVVCTHASNLTGDLLDIGFVGNFCRKHGLLFLLDASQTAGTFPIDMVQNHIDVVCFTGHKSLLGPQGTGGLCIREGLNPEPLTVGGTGVQSFREAQPTDFPTHLEAGTLNSHGLAGLGAGIRYLTEQGPDRLRQREHNMMHRFLNLVRDVPGIRLYGDFSRERAPIVALNIGDYDSAQVSDELAQRFSVATRPGAHCAPRLHRALGTAEQGAVRFSWSCMNTMEETEAAAEAVRILAEEG